MSLTAPHATGDLLGANHIGLPGQVTGRADQADFYRANDRIVLERGEPRRNEEWISYPDGTLVLMDTLKAPLRSAEAVG